MLLVAMLPWIVLAGFISAAATVFRLFFLPGIKGRLGEARVNARLGALDPAQYVILSDVMLPSAGATTQIDHIVVSRFGIFVVETKTYSGWIFGGENDARWTQSIFRHKEHFQNPLRQNYKHIKTLSELLRLPEKCFISVVAFAGDCTFKTPMPGNVIYARHLDDFILSHPSPLVEAAWVPRIAEGIRAWAATVTEQQKAHHVAHLRESHRPAPAGGPPPFCPRCGSPMVKRTSRRNTGRFWGCPKYPACRGIRKMA